MGFFYLTKMSKDPAFLFYTSDFLTGTMTMTNEQVGKYIRLLCFQHQKGDLSEKDMLFICGSYDEEIFAKFEKIGEKFRNKRLFEEVEKRKKYSESRRNNRLKKEEPKEEIKEDMLNTSLPYVEHMENENENEIEDINKDKIKNNIDKPKSKTLTFGQQELTIEEIFEQCWKAYQGASDRQVGSKQEALKKFKLLEKEDLEKIRVHLPKYIVNHQRTKHTEYFPNFTVYLNQRKFEDEKMPYADKVAEFENNLNNWYKE
jgi:uncharacterized protein YdaU (DUF1376 family)